MREMGLEAWKWAAAGALMGLLTLMMVMGLGNRRGTWLNGLRLSLWMMLISLGGAAGCSETTQIGHPDASDTNSGDTGYADMSDPRPDTSVPDTEEDTEPDFSCVECYQAPWDPEPDSSTDPDEDADDDADVEADVPDEGEG